ncbi:MAG: hypothetical protein WC511_07115 [Candidatus Pacearchaeota archaeon]
MAPTKGKKNPNMARNGKENPTWKGGKSSDYRRKLMGAKKGELVHHKDHDKSNNAKSNFEVLKPGSGVTAIGKHNKKHDRVNNKPINK